MKISNLFRSKVIKALVIIVTVLLTSDYMAAQGWYNTAWQYRTQITISNPGGTVLSDYQVQIILSSPDFDFTKVLNDGSDIRVTSDDGITPIPFWIENSWHTSGPDTIWTKVPVIPAGGTTVFVYYGNPTPPLAGQIEVPPVRTYTKEDTWIDPIDDPGNGEQLLAENMVYDDETGHYWLIFRNSRTSPVSIGLIWSDTPSDPASWHWYAGNPVITSGDSPHIIKEGDRWYIFYGDRSSPAPWPISVQSSEHVYGPYGDRQEILQPGASGSWEDYRVDEPYVFQRTDGKWIIAYMGDAGTSSVPVEQIGYASSDNFLGPYEKFASNPIIALGPPDSFDNGVVADPWVYSFGGVDYIGYAGVNNITGICPHTAYVTTSDWQTFTKQPVIVAPGSMTSYDNFGVFRGAVSRVADDYVFIYTARYRTSAGGANLYRLGIATQPAVIEDPINDPREVFDFYEGFNDAVLNPQHWYTHTVGNEGTASLSNGRLILSAVSNSSDFGAVAVRSSLPVYFGTIMECRGAHPTNLPDYNQINLAQVGHMQYDFAWTHHLRFKDGPNSLYYEMRGQNGGTEQGPNILTNIPFATYPPEDDRTYGVCRPSSGIAKFRIDNSAFATLDPLYVPTVAPLYPWMMAYAEAGLASPSNFEVDWVRIRKFVETEPIITLGSESSLNTQWTGAVSTDWATAANWTSGVPSIWNNITIPAATNSPLLNGSLTIGAEASLAMNSGGALTVTGDMTNNGIMTIGSTLSSSGSLIVNGTASGDITYNRQLKSGSDATSDWHLAAPPVVTNSDANTGKVNTVYEWSETANTWSSIDITSALPGHGYNIRQEEASDGVISFTGPIVNSDLTMAASSPYADFIAPDDSYFERTYVAGRSLENLGGRGWNLLGNPYPSAINASAFINANYNATPSLSQFDPNYVALYLFDGTSRRYYYIGNPTGWSGGGGLSATHVQAGQGFFVLAMNDNSEFTFTRAMQEHSTATAMLKSGETDDRWPGLQLKVAHPDGEVITTVVYNQEMTTGVDPGYDVGLFKSGQDVELYTILPAGDNGINYTRQSLPLSVADTIIVPVGVDTEDGGVVIFSATTVPAGSNKFWLEDRTAGTFTDLSSATYTVTLPARSYGTGRFYIIASTNTPTGVNLPEVEAGLRIWSSFGKIIIKGSVTEGSVCELFDMQGNRIMETRLTDGELNTISLPSGTDGVCLVRVTDGVKVTSKKVVVL